MSTILYRKAPWVLFVLCILVLGVVLYRNSHEIIQIQKLNSILKENIFAPATVLQTVCPDPPVIPEMTHTASESRPYLIPSDEKLRAMNDAQLQAVYWKYINTIQVLCRNQTRLGVLKDGGKEICIDDLYKPKEPCLVYSFGSNNQFDFENAIKANFKCQVHTFDPSMKGRGKRLNVPSMVTFHDVGLWGKDARNERGWQMNTLSTIIKDLKHETTIIDILKIDVEGGEWFAFPQMFQSGVLKNVKQISIEIHYGNKWTKSVVQTGVQLQILRHLYEHGFQVFMHERNLYEISPGQITLVNEISLINMRYRGSK